MREIILTSIFMVHTQNQRVSTFNAVGLSFKKKYGWSLIDS
jgi:hypothetical protein